MLINSGMNFVMIVIVILAIKVFNVKILPITHKENNKKGILIYVNKDPGDIDIKYENNKAIPATPPVTRLAV